MDLLMRSLFQAWWWHEHAGPRSHSSAHRPATRALVWLEDANRHTAADVRRMLAHSGHWMRPTSILRTSGPVSASAFDAAILAGGGGELVVCAAPQPEATASLSKHAARLGLAFVDTAFPEPGTFAADLCREVAHHDFEHGGVNEWDGAPVLHSNAILRRLSSVHCKSCFPHFAMQELLSLRPMRGEGPLEALDVGCGPVTLLRWGVLQGLLRVTGVDPLLDFYDVVLARHGLDALPGLRPEVRLSCTMESAPRDAIAGKFDVVYSNNAMDHTQDPAQAIAQTAMALRPGGLCILGVSTDEGTKQGWDQLHQFDFHAVGSDGVEAVGKDGRAIPIVGPGSPLVMRRVVCANDLVTVVLAHAR